MGTDELIDEAVKQVQGRKLPIGSAAAHLSDPVTRELIAYENDGQVAVLSWDGVIKRHPASEIFDPNAARDEAIKMKFGAAGERINKFKSN